MNQQAFTARCTEAGIDYEPFCKHPSYEILNGLEKDYPSPVERNCKVMVAAQYILLAGREVHRSLINQEPATENSETSTAWTLKKWPLWALKFKEIEEKGDCEPKVLAAVAEARKKMTSISQEIATEPAVKEESMRVEECT